MTEITVQETIRLEKIKVASGKLKEYLNQYHQCKKRREQLEKRLRNIKHELDAPIGGVGYSLTPRSVTNKIGTGSASIVFKMADIEEHIITQRDNVARTMIKAMDIIEFLGNNTMERTILEYRYIDCLDLEHITQEVNLSRSACYHYLNAGIEKLLEFKKVQKIIEDYNKDN